MQDFWKVIFPEGETGYVAVALKSRSKYELKYVDLQQRNKLVELVKHKDKGDLYFCPSILNVPKLSKASIKHSYVIWTDQDVSSNGVQLPSPSLVVASGSAGHTHAYWRLDEPLTWPETELRTRGLVVSTHADPSGVDATQMLRVPDTLNHKNGKKLPVTIISRTSISYSPSLFQCVSPDYYDYQYTKLDLVSTLLSVTDEKTRNLLLQDPTDVGDRSEALMHFAHVAAEAGLTDDQRYTLLFEADERWGKFSERDDRDLRLGEIVARSSRFEVTDDLDDQAKNAGPVEKIRLLGWKSVSHESRTITWVVEGLIRTKGLIFFTASSGVGKSTAAMNLAASLVLKESWLDFKIVEKPQRILYESLEMDEEEINYFLSHMNQALPGDVQDTLEEQVIFDPVGMPVYLNTKEGQKYYEDRLDIVKPTGLVIDTLGASVSTSLTDEKEMRVIADWIDKIRQERNIWVLVNHHYRKASNQNKNAERVLDDMYGAQLIANRANTVLGWRQFPRTDNILEVSSLKGRFRQQGGHGSHIFVRRTSSLWLEKDSSFTPKGMPSASKEAVEFDVATGEKELPY